jgi:acyl-homoserine lactone acylase PvdQ
VRRAGTAIVIALAAALGPATAHAQGPTPDPYEDAGNSYRNILPPGQNGHANAADIAAFMASGDRPPHNSDQLQPYEDLVFATPGLSGGQLDEFFKDASFGVAPGDVEQKYQPCGETGPPPDPCDPVAAQEFGGPNEHPCNDVTVQRDEGYGVPHIYGATRSGAMCAAGYVAAEDRLFLIDVLRHAGRAELSEFAGGTEGNREMDREQWSIAPYREKDLRRQLTQFDDLYGEQGDRLGRDLLAYVAGLNQYVFEARLDRANKMPGEYVAFLGQDTATAGPDDFKPTDIVAIASLVGGIFGKGGGGELDSAVLLDAARDRFGHRDGRRVWADLRSAEDPEAPTTVRGKRFPYQKPPDNPARESFALPDSGTVDPTEVVVASSDGGEGSAEGFSPLDGLLSPPDGASNALVVSGDKSTGGHPTAVFGPQTGYFTPQLLMEMDIHGPGIDARGAAFAGTNLYVQLGRGVDYTWSATSAGQDNTDTFALDLCEPGGGRPTMDSNGYRYRGSCRQFDSLRRENEWTPNPTSPSAGSETLRVRRTALGLETARARLDGDPVVYVKLRSTYMHEVDSARGFADFNNPNKIENAADYQRAAHKVGYTFNWLYADQHDVAYFNSGENPERAPDTNPNFPVRACPTSACEYEWRNYDPIRERGRLTGNRADYTPFSEHPQKINQTWFTSWNNKQAGAYRAADDNFEYHSLYRSIPLDERIRSELEGGGNMSLPELVDAMEDAGTVDLRGDQVMPWMLRMINRPGQPVNVAPQAPCPSDLGVGQAVKILRAWGGDGAHRRDANGDERYEHSCAIQIMDAWWPKAVKRIFRPSLGDRVYQLRLAIGGIDNEPNNHGAHLGSAYQGGFYGYVHKDLRAILGRNVDGEYSRPYCGSRKRGNGSFREGNRRTCRILLTRSLRRALEVPRESLYDNDEVCENEGGDLEPQYCYDTVRHTPASAITQPLIHWINRPTFQQVVQVRQGR